MQPASTINKKHSPTRAETHFINSHSPLGGIIALLSSVRFNSRTAAAFVPQIRTGGA